MKTISRDEYSVLMSIVNSEYTDGLDRILSARENDDGSVICVGQDGIKQVACKITDTGVEIRLLNPDRVTGDSPTAQFSQKQDTPDRIATNLQKLGDPIVSSWLRQIEQMLTTSDDLESAREALFQLYPDLDSTDLAEQMTDAMAAVSMAGFWEAGTETGDEAEFAMSDLEVEFKIAEGTVKEKNGKKYILTNSRWRLANKVEKKPKPKPKQGLSPGFVGDIPIDQVSADPKRFQYKLLGAHTKTGEVGSLSGVQTYDSNLAGIVQVWKDPADGKLYVINGHNRLALAQRAGVKDVTSRIIDAPDAATARGIGALTNIAEGRGTALDAAKFFRDSGLTADDIKKKGIPIREKIATDGLGIAALEPQLFDKVVNGDITESRAALIGKTGLSGSQQVDLYKLGETKSKKGRITDEAFTELAESVKASQTSQGTLFDLFGASSVEKSNAIERASLSAGIKRQMSRDKKLFGLVSKTKVAQDLARAGNQIDKESSGKVADQASQLLGVFDQLKNNTGGISSVLNTYATKVSDGALTPARAQSEAYKEIADLIKSGKL